MCFVWHFYQPITEHCFACRGQSSSSAIGETNRGLFARLEWLPSIHLQLLRVQTINERRAFSILGGSETDFVDWTSWDQDKATTSTPRISFITVPKPYLNNNIKSIGYYCWYCVKKPLWLPWNFSLVPVWSQFCLSDNKVLFGICVISSTTTIGWTQWEALLWTESMSISGEAVLVGVRGRRAWDFTEGPRRLPRFKKSQHLGQLSLQRCHSTVQRSDVSS